ncbi:MAG: hypothetical protein Unbinned5213contig1001_11 [Prokaryotic dsDNA virus sp.]|nr:MAG: hypothetical protein Unbinned5213contig1001_11 [Prokaryotic dsDNA virus sp.]|tara:strand:+ start:18687 stop:18845 length:159 start_codon:yes stop_codon:yes gene_type:complete
MIEFISNNWGELIIGLLAFVKVIVNLTPTEKDNKVFEKLDHFINYFVKDRLK